MAEKDFLGTGWSFPPTFSRVDHAVEMVKGDRDIQQSLFVLFSTGLGDRVMLPQYGSSLVRMVFQALTTTLKSQIQNMVEQAILNDEPRIDAEDVEVRQDPKDPNRILIDVTYTIRQTNARSNMVYPFYLDQATIPPTSP